MIADDTKQKSDLPGISTTATKDIADVPNESGDVRDEMGDTTPLLGDAIA